jgi:hypothetical protein
VVFDDVTDAESLEALACREAVALSRDLLLRKVMVVSNCLSVIKNMTERSRCAYGQIIREIKSQEDSFEEISFTHENRSMAQHTCT